MIAKKLHSEDNLETVLKHDSLAVGFIGLAECIIALTRKHHGQSSKSQDLGLNIIRHMRKWMDEATIKLNLNFTLISTPAEGLSGRFVALDKKKFGIIDVVTDMDYYSNSFHVPVHFPITAYDKIQTERHIMN